MGRLEAWICACYAFAPAIVFFIRFVSKEPLRIILFMIGAFFWLVSLLFTSIEWQLTKLLTSSSIVILLVFILNQEIARVLFFLFARKAYDGLIKLGTSNKLIIPEIALLAHDSRHTFSFVCGFGFGAMACFFSVANVIADMSKDGIPGFPPALEKSQCSVHRTTADAAVPFAYSIAGTIVVFLNVCWTVLQWDSLHKFVRSKRLMNSEMNQNVNGQEDNQEGNALPSYWWLGIIASFVGHIANSLLSTLSPGGKHWYILSAQFILLLICVALTLCVTGFKQPESWTVFITSCFKSECCKKSSTNSTNEPNPLDSAAVRVRQQNANTDNSPAPTAV